MDTLQFLISPQGLGVIASLLVSAWVAYLLLKKYKPQAVLFLGGITLLLLVILINVIWGEPAQIIGNSNLPSEHILNKIKTLNNPFLDIFASIEGLFSNRIAGLGIIIMSVMGFVKYMDAIGANKALVRVGVKPLRFIKSPYIVIVVAFLIGLAMKMAITSAAGLGVLLMATMFPILLQLGVSRITATAVIATSGCIDLGPAAGIGVAITQAAGLLTEAGKADTATYFIKYQLPVAIPTIITIAILHFFVQRYFDKKQGYYKPRHSEFISESTDTVLRSPNEIPHQVRNDGETNSNDKDEIKAPTFYAVLPLIPLLLVLFFNESIIIEFNKLLEYFGFTVVFIPKTIGLVAAIFLSLFIAMLVEFFRWLDARKVLDSIQTVFDGMGVAFATIITLIVAGEVFASGLLSTGSINTMLDFAKNAGAGIVPITLFMQGLIVVASVLMGSGDAAIFSFLSVGTVVADHFGVEAISVLMPMQICSSLARSFSPITAVVVAVSAIAGISPVEVVKRTAIPMIGGIIVLSIANIILFL